MKVYTTLFFQIVMTSYTIAYQDNDIKTTCLAKSSLRIDLNKTRNLTNTFGMQNGIEFYFSYILKAVLTVYAPKVFGSRQSLTTCRGRHISIWH